MRPRRPLLLLACVRGGSDPVDPTPDRGDDLDSGGTDDTGAAGDPLLGPFLDGGGDPLVAELCGRPFLSDVDLRPDPTTPTGARVAFGPTTPRCRAPASSPRPTSTTGPTASRPPRVR